jgi:hypothetical protein
MNIDNYIAEINAAIDTMRADLWDTDGLPDDNTREAVDNYSKARDRQTKRGELWGAILAFRHEEITEEDLYMFMQSFDRSLTYYQFIELMENL